jgi:hypothetical protein
MPKHKFTVGQRVDYQPGKSAFVTASAAFTIVRQLPMEGSELKYRIKSSGETFERVASETQLSRRPT